MGIFSTVQRSLYFPNCNKNDIGLGLVNFPNLDFS
jgi:hypothetical protein